MEQQQKTSRPDFSDIASGAEFVRWYWLKEELVAICKVAGLPCQGAKFELRDRIAYALDHKGKVLSPLKKKRPTSTFPWANADLSLTTVITDNISFGPNVRNFLKSQIGSRFSCHSDFMDWVRAHPGKTLADAVQQWVQLENRKQDPAFQRSIAQHNMLSQYVRDFLDDNKEGTFKAALCCWNRKKQLPTEDGFVRYAKGDLQLQ